LARIGSRHMEGDIILVLLTEGVGTTSVLERVSRRRPSTGRAVAKSSLGFFTVESIVAALAGRRDGGGACM
jgi:hypothetical protein